MGSLSGVAIKNSMTIGYIKRNRNIGVYKQLVRRDLHLMLEILAFLHPKKADAIRGLKIDFVFAEPFSSDNRENQSRIADLYQKRVLSLEEAVRQLAICDDVNSEIKRLKDAEKNDAGTSKSEGTNNDTNTKSRQNAYKREKLKKNRTMFDNPESRIVCEDSAAL